MRLLLRRHCNHEGEFDDTTHDDLTELVMLRASQINGCGVCVDMHTKGARRDGETEERLHAVAAWRDTAFFSDDERAALALALALAESVTRLSDRSDPVPDQVWDEAARHFDEVALASLLVAIGLINFFNRINVAARQVARSVPMPA
jgi:AhpD family alkylhydroperoxidase